MKSADSTSHVVFEDIRDLLGSLHCCTSGLYPASVIRTQKGQLAIPASLLGNANAFDTLKKQYGWRFELSLRPPKGESISLSNIIESAWTYKDPFLYERNSERYALMWDGIARFDPSSPGIRYLLGAKDEERAQEILSVLTELVTPDIEAVPCRLEAVGTESPFPYFWITTNGRPSLTALQIADRAWWGPIGDQAVEIYEEWPYHLEIPEVSLRRINWGDGAQVVLLSRQTPQVLTMKTGETGVCLPLPNLKNLRVNTEQRVEVLSAVAHQPAFSFSVDLKLVDDSSRNPLRNRIRELERDINAKQELLSFLIERSDAYEDAGVTCEPLLIYGESKDSIPLELRDLLVEWADQKEDFGALRYHKVRADSWQAGWFTEDQEIHIVTTARALGERSNQSVGLRLREYRRGKNASFDLLPEWARVGLRLFVPQERQLRLYPDFQPGRVAAEKLSQSLLPEGRRDLNDWLALLVPSNEGKICVCQLAVAEFKPLAESFEWKCAIDTPQKRPSVVKTNQLTGQILGSLEEALRSSINSEAIQRVQACEEELENELQLVAGTLEQRRQTITALEKQVNDLAPALGKAAEIVTTLKSRAPDALEQMEEIRQLASELTKLLDELAALEKAIGVKSRKSSRLLAWLKRLLDRLRRN